MTEYGDYATLQYPSVISHASDGASRFDSRFDPLWDYFTADLSFDQEFDVDDDSGALPSGWSWVNQGTGVYAQAWGAGLIHHPGQSGDDIKAVVQAVPSASAWTAITKVALSTPDNNSSAAGIYLDDSSSGKLAWFSITNGHFVQLQRWNSPTSWASVESTSNLTAGWYINYLRVVRNSAASWDFAVSGDGVSWMTLVAGYDLSAWITPDRLGLTVFRNGTYAAEGSFHWFRVR